MSGLAERLNETSDRGDDVVDAVEMTCAFTLTLTRTLTFTVC